jgi:phosphoribosylanthranilate isomerase
MFRIKICGITNTDDALAASKAGVDAVGLNFFPSSPRFINHAMARRICIALPPNIVKVGVFVNAPETEISQTFDAMQLDLIQLHGDEPPDFLSRLGGKPVMRAFRLGPEGLQPVLDYLDICNQLQCMPKLVLLDAHAKGVFGGSGEKADWSICTQYARQKGLPPLVLAGGLNPSNVAEAIKQVRPAAVDTASGVESGSGRKNLLAVKAFIDAARNAFGNI